MSDPKVPYDRWLWVELIGFDNAQPDYGVEAYLANAGFVPDVVLLFLFNPDFIHTHEGLEADAALPFDCCSYGGHPSGYERDRQDWTRFQLRGLIRELQRRGIAVLVSVFDIFVVDEWLSQHPEVLHVNRAGERMRSVCPWKRLTDGTYYEDFFARKLGEVLRDYGFDGYHQADGYCHPRLPVYEGDFSDDMVDQFVQATGLSLPDGLADSCGDQPAVIGRRAEWIWRHVRPEWLAFYAERTASFTGKVAAAAHAQGKLVVANNALTREPFQALYRYGVDYRRMAEAGLDGFVLETVAPGVAIGGEGGQTAMKHYDLLAMVMLTKAQVPHLPLHCLNGVHDINEQWDVLRHGTALLEREVYCNSGLFRWRPDGALERCSAGPVVCLADGLQRHEWAWLQEWWGRGFRSLPRRVLGATVVWSEAAHRRQLEEFLQRRCFTTHKLLYELLAHGAPVFCVADIGDVDVVRGPLLVLNPQLLPDEELAQVGLDANRTVIAIGRKTASMPEPDSEMTDGDGPDALWCGIYGRRGDWSADLAPGGPESPLLETLDLPEPYAYFEELAFQPVSEAFLAACARAVAECSEAVQVLARADVIRVEALEMSEDRLRLLVGNDAHPYVITELDVGRPIESLRIVTPFPGTTPAFSGSRFGFRVPGRGMVVVDVTLSQAQDP